MTATWLVNLPRRLRDLERLAGPAADRLALQELQRRHASLEPEHRAALVALAALRRMHRLEERFRRPVGGFREVLGGKVALALVALVGLVGLVGDGALVGLAGAQASLWRPGNE